MMCQNNQKKRFLHFAKKNLVNCPTIYGKGFAEEFPAVSQDYAIATYDAEIKFLKFDDFKAEGIPDVLQEVLKNLLIESPVYKTFDLPQFCIVGTICFTQLDVAINNGYISADASAEINPLMNKILTLESN